MAAKRSNAMTQQTQQFKSNGSFRAITEAPSCTRTNDYEILKLSFKVCCKDKIHSKGAKCVSTNLYLYQLISISKYKLGLFAKSNRIIESCNATVNLKNYLNHRLT